MKMFITTYKKSLILPISNKNQMKNLIVNPFPKNSVNLHEISDSKQNYGFGFKKTDAGETDYGILIDEKYNAIKTVGEKTYFARCLSNFFNGNGWQCRQKGQYKPFATLEQWIKNFENNEMEWYVFETEKEMFEWMAKHC